MNRDLFCDVKAFVLVVVSSITAFAIVCAAGLEPDAPISVAAFIAATGSYAEALKARERLDDLQEKASEDRQREFGEPRSRGERPEV